LLPQILEVIEDIVVPWHRELKEKRDLLREDPFVGFVAMAVLGAIFYFFFRGSPSWAGFFLLYGGIAMFFLGSIAALASGWFGWGLFRYAAWPTTIVILLVYGFCDTFTVKTTFDPVPLKHHRVEENALSTTTHTDTFKRFSGRPLTREIDTNEDVLGRTIHRSISAGPLNPAGQKHGQWITYSLVPKRSAETMTWYYNDKEVSESEWRSINEMK
jgi:hypothetical protein